MVTNTVDAGRDGADANWLLSGNNTLYLVAPISDQDEIAPVVGGLLSQVRRHIEHSYAATDTAFNPPVLMVIDEAGNMPLEWLPKWVATCAAMGVQLVTVWQSIAQIRDAYDTAADAVITNHRTKVFFAGNSDEQTLGYASKLVGEEEILTRSATSSVSRQQTTQDSTQASPYAPLHLMRTMRPGEALLIHGTIRPVHIETLHPEPRQPDPDNTTTETGGMRGRVAGLVQARSKENSQW